ncbi:MAG: nitroreductase family protein [Candidatus Omnitrophica bacterium]|nr:nitroreductase family protein [Candidatus Omnitrophota bacterium]
MSLIIVDKNKCKADGICTKVCPIEILKMDADKQMPAAIENAEEMCINCGHCVCVCPHAALSLAKMPVKDLSELPADWRIPEDKLITFLKGRRSIRQYKNKEVFKEDIEKLIDIARYAPTGLNKQPVRWTVVYAKDHTRKLVELVVAWMRKLIDLKSPMAESLRMDLTIAMWQQGKDRICRGAPHVILGHGLKEDMIAPQSTTIAFTYLELAAVSMGLGPCWAGYVNMAVNSSEEVRNFLGLSSRSACFGAMLLGFSKYEYKRIPLRNNPKIKWR